ncbi:MAG: RsmB/NOP family class I SAM-dependent RNA methyltransferase [Candidatus Micrarchaeota archaeon]|nr:RsmB/NOP family class I SAM-dependent RNA methyltransferase [Candidatus Micrarchaeota archaeon]MCX8154521.1 RsmB/NOP family class I SAM-dependent RNA methyltransferase [Candidatus Micrarchaeota archaeon]
METDIGSELNRYRDVLEFLETKKYIRVNWIKTRKRPNYRETFLPYIYEIPKTLKVGNTLEYLAGYIHSQSLASAIPPHVLDPNPRDIVYDAAAAPGSKTTQIAMLMENRGVIVANDKPDRIPALRSNIERLGVINTAIISRDAKRTPDFIYSKALVDAPCTALGAHKYAWRRVTDSIVRTLSMVQYRMLEATYRALRPGGVIVYSTCTFTYAENEGVVSTLLSRTDARLVKIHLPISYDRGYSNEFEDLQHTIRLHPRDVGEYFYVAKIMKPFSGSVPDL